MTNAAPWAATAGNKFREVARTAENPRTKLLAEGLSARIGADHLGHTQILMTQDKYMARGRVHTAVAELLDRTINDGIHWLGSKKMA